jgi:hypothetical protein
MPALFVIQMVIYSFIQVVRLQSAINIRSKGVIVPDYFAQKLIALADVGLKGCSGVGEFNYLVFEFVQREVPFIPVPIKECCNPGNMKHPTVCHLTPKFIGVIDKRGGMEPFLSGAKDQNAQNVRFDHMAPGENILIKFTPYFVLPPPAI